MRALVTGGAGFIGGAITAALLERGHEVVVLDNLIASSSEQIPAGAEFVEGDLRDPIVLSEVTRDVEVVFHEAAIRSVPRSIDEPTLVHECNVTGTLNLLIACENAGVRRLIYASSSSAYGGAHEGRSSEDMHPRPLSPYAASKLSAEYYCTVWSELGKLSTVSLRYFNVFGPGQSAESKYAAVFPAFVLAVLDGKAPTIHWDGEQSRDFTFIDDVVRANLAAADSNSRVDGQVINIAGGSPRTINEVYSAICTEVGVSIEPRYAPRREGDIRHSYADPLKAETLLSWRSQTAWEDAVSKTVAWFSARRVASLIGDDARNAESP